jgi:hypothetical protein
VSRVLEGGCFCGAVRYRIGGASWNVARGHCTMCRRLSAAAFVTWATVRTDDFAVVRGTPVRLASSARAARTFCGNCGTPLTFQLHAGREELDVTVCSFDDPEALTPEDHTQTAIMLSWIRLADSLPRHDHDRPPVRA